MTQRPDNPAAGDRLAYVVGILAGGPSRRMGQPKALLKRPDGLVFIEHVAGVARRLQPKPDEVVLLGESSLRPDSLAHLPVLPDVVPAAGPLAGLSTLLDRAGARWALLLPCDMPRLSEQVLQELLHHARADVDAVAFRRPDHPATYHACCALYHPRIAALATARLHDGRRALQGLLEAIRVASVVPSPEYAACLVNVNTPADYANLA
jgi:molybdopterin-guanine dinucleotide biosynthesis protein A